jgi:uncharacterized protein (TIRG00374 family)
MAALLVWFLYDADFDRMGESLRQAEPSLLVLSVLLALLGYWLRVCRWQLILLPVARVRHSSAVIATCLGYAGITLLPARMGDIVRPVVLARREQIPVSASLASILTERIFDLWTVILFFFLFLIWPPEMVASGPSRELQLVTIGGYVVGAGVVVGTLILLGLFQFQERFINILTAPIARVAPSWRQPVINFLGHFLDGLRVIQRPRDLLITVVASILVWLAIYWQLKVALLAFSIDLPLRACFFLVAGSVVGLAIPTPGAVGGFHKAMELAMSLFVGVGAGQLVKSFIIVHHAICFVPITLIGLALIPVLGLSATDVSTLATGEQGASS